MSAPAASATNTATNNVSKTSAYYKKSTKNQRGNTVQSNCNSKTAATVAENAQKAISYEAQFKKSVQDLENLQRKYEELSAENKNLKAECEKTQRVNESLRNQNPDNAQRVVQKENAVAEGVRQPTVPVMEEMLESIKPSTEQLKNLHEEINSLRNNSQTKAENYSTLSKEALEEANKEFLTQFNALVERYKKLEPTVKDDLAALKSTIANATRSDIPLHHMETFSSHHLIPLSTVQEKAKMYQALLHRCSDTRAEIKSEFEKAERRFMNAAAHINKVQWAIEYKENKAGYLFGGTIVAVWPPQAPVEEAAPTEQVEATEKA